MKTTIRKKADASYVYKTTRTPVGELKLIATDQGLAAILWENDKPKRVPLSPLTEDPTHPVLQQTERELSEYFEGNRTGFSVNLAAVGTEFQKRVWWALSEIPFGETRSYGEIAQRIGQPSAVRAVGAANGKNPISIIVPCHRIIGSSGALVGYAGGLPRKKWLLAHEHSQRRLYTEMIGTPSCVST